jgi:hypothetical protein
LSGTVMVTSFPVLGSSRVIVIGRNSVDA